MSTVVFFTNLNNLIIIAAGSYYIMMGTMTVADLVVFLMYLLLFIRPIMQLTLLTERVSAQHGRVPALYGAHGYAPGCHRLSPCDRCRYDPRAH